MTAPAANAPVPRISYPLNKLLTAVARQHQLREALTDDDLAGHPDLTPEQRTALKAGDTGALYALGANPYLIRRIFRSRFKV